MQGVLYKQKPHSQEAIPWDSDMNHGSELDPCHARAAIEQAFREGWMFVFATDASGVSSQLHHAGEFDPAMQTKVTMMPAMAGGS